MGELRVECEQRNGALVVKIGGDAGLTSAETLERGLTGASARHPTFAVLDLSELTFISSLGMGLLVAFCRGVEQRGGKVRVAGVRAQVMDAIKRARLGDLFNVRATVDQALSEA